MIIPSSTLAAAWTISACINGNIFLKIQIKIEKRMNKKKYVLLARVLECEPFYRTLSP